MFGRRNFKFNEKRNLDELFDFLPVGKCVDIDYKFDEGEMKITMCRVSENEGKFKFTVGNDTVMEGKMRVRDM